MRKIAVVLPLSLALSGCFATSGSGRTQVVAPQSVGAAYSEMSLQRGLLLSDARPCRPDTCAAVTTFNKQILRVGERLIRAAAAEARDGPIPRFDIRLLDTVERGTASSSAGTVVVHGGLRDLEVAEPALAFILAREMGHILGRHHDEDSATNLAFSVVGSLLLPVGHLIRGAAAALSATDGVAAATTAASFVGATAYKATYRADQLREADLLALRLTMRAGWSVEDVAAALAAITPRLKDEGWAGDLLASKMRLDHLTAGPPWPLPAEDQAAAPTGPALVASTQAPPITPSTTLTRSP